MEVRRRIFCLVHLQHLGAGRGRLASPCGWLCWWQGKAATPAQRNPLLMHQQSMYNVHTLYSVHTYRGPWQCASSSCIERVICLNWRLPPYARLNTFLQFISPCMSSGVGAVKESPCRNFYSILMMSVNSALLHKHPLSELGVYGTS